MEKKRVVVSLGHNSVGGTTTLDQLSAIRHTVKVLADLIEQGYQLIITHSNGPQVSMIHKAMTELRRLYPDYTPVPMCVCSAMSQGYVGYDIQNCLRTELLGRGISSPVSTVLTQVTVDPYDEAFYEPSKAIGRFMTAEEARMEEQKGNYVTEDERFGFRRIVAAPKPIEIVEIDAIRALLEAGQNVVAAGGGGIPVMEQKRNLKGASAVIEKDSIAGRLAIDTAARQLIIYTSVDCVYKDFNQDSQEEIRTMDTAQAKAFIEEGQFAKGSMLPKIEAAVSYLEAVPGGSVIITSLENTGPALHGRAGTLITA